MGKSLGEKLKPGYKVLEVFTWGEIIDPKAIGKNKKILKNYLTSLALQRNKKIL